MYAQQVPTTKGRIAHRWTSMLAVAVLGLWLEQPPAHADSISIENHEITTQSAADGWTAERYRQAQPMPLPEPAERQSATAEELQALPPAANVGEEPVAGKGRRPSVR